MKKNNTTSTYLLYSSNFKRVHGAPVLCTHTQSASLHCRMGTGSRDHPALVKSEHNPACVAHDVFLSRRRTIYFLEVIFCVKMLYLAKRKLRGQNHLFWLNWLERSIYHWPPVQEPLLMYSRDHKFLCPQRPYRRCTWAKQVRWERP